MFRLVLLSNIKVLLVGIEVGALNGMVCRYYDGEYTSFEIHRFIQETSFSSTLLFDVRADGTRRVLYYFTAVLPCIWDSEY